MSNINDPNHNPSSNDLSFYFSFFTDIGIILLPTLGYIAQLLKIKQLKTSNGFSKKVPLILLLAHIFRVYFWVGKYFSVVLLVSSCIMIIMQSILLYFCVKYPHDLETDSKVDYFDVSTFWEWPHILDYFYVFTFLIVNLTILSNYIGFDNSFYIEVLGSLSAIFEGFLAIPQIIENYKNKAIISLSYILVLSWIFGDFFKTFYYFFNEAPYQIILSSIFQLLSDFVIIGQISYYKQNNSLSIESQ
jgi:hypothetical protein